MHAARAGEVVVLTESKSDCPNRSLGGLNGMVSVGKLKAGQARYYLDQAESHPSPAHAVASGAEDYYVGGTEAAGRWQGRGAAALGLTDTVEAEALHRVLAGQDPRTGTELRRSGSVAGFDVTFSAPEERKRPVRDR
jgi:hypothetical protein